MTDTIFALATAPGRSGVSIIRVSGPESFGVAEKLSGRLPAPRTSRVASLRDESGDVIDIALVLVFESGHSFTGEDVVEFQLHGSPAIVQAVLSFLGRQQGLRIAEPGEFTRRALENERLDLAQVEGLADLIAADTELQRKQAFGLFSGKLSAKAEGWRTDLIRAAALIEATIDFVDEDVPVDVFPEVRELLARTAESLESEARGVGVAERLRDGFQVAILGAPNSGKSTLLNTIAGRDVAITSEIAGTTRDVIEVQTDLAGIPVTFLDTAGLRETGDTIEAVGVRRAIDRAKDADLRVLVMSVDTISGDWPGIDYDIMVYSKGDLPEARADAISGKTGAGVPGLLDEIAKRLQDKVARISSATRKRHEDALRLAVSALREVDAQLQNGVERTELVAEGIRQAIRALDSLVGRIDVENILDRIFSDFCIGK